MNAIAARVITTIRSATPISRATENPSADEDTAAGMAAAAAGVTASDSTFPRVAPGDPRWTESVEAAFNAGEPIASVLRMTPVGATFIVALLAVAIFTGTSFAILGSVEVTARGPAALRTSQGTVALLAETTGPVAWVAVSSGERVTAGQRLVGIDATALTAALEESHRRLEFLDSSSALSGERQDQLVAEQHRQLESRVRAIDERMSLHNATVSRLSERLADMEELVTSGFMSVHARDDAVDRLDEARRQHIGLRDERARLNGEMAALQAGRETDRLRRREERSIAIARRETARTMLRQTVASAPRDGVVEAIVVRPGELVQPGTIVARLVPDTAPTQIVAFIAERDRAFLEPGTRASVEIRQLPAGEFGALHGIVDRVGTDLVSANEWRDVMGDSNPPPHALYRVEITPQDDARLQALSPWLRVGMQADVRFTLRERRIITLLLEPLRKWLG